MSKSVRAIVSVTNDLYTDQRVHKVCTFLQAQGYDVLLIGRKRKSSVELPKRTYATKRIKMLVENGPLFYAFFNLRLFFILLFKRADVLVANDLDTLLANYCARKFKRSATLVYDSHEYFTEVPELTNRPSVQRIWLRIERKIFPSLKNIYTVNKSIAEIYSHLYQKNVRVVRNISPLWKPSETLDKKTLGIPENKSLIILQGAGINIDRGAEEAVEAMQSVDAVLMIVGDGDVLPQLKKRVIALNVQDRVLFFGKQSYDRMMNYTHFADIGLTLDKPSNLNYKLSLPNKVFDYMHAGTAVVATDIKEVTQIVLTHEIGEIITALTAEHLAKTLNNLLQDQERLSSYKNNCRAAAQQENWERETEVLKEIYPYVGE